MFCKAHPPPNGDHEHVGIQYGTATSCNRSLLPLPLSSRNLLQICLVVRHARHQ